MTRPEKVSIGICTLAVISGGLVAFSRCSGADFARTGAVVVIVALIFGAIKLGSRLDKWEKFLVGAQAEVVRYLPNAHHLSEDERENVLRQVMAESKDEIGKAIECTKTRLLRVEAGMLIFGTVIWGFGDLLFVRCSTSN